MSLWGKSYYWQPIGSRIWEIDWFQNEWPWPLFRGRFKVTSLLRYIWRWIISETVRDRGLVPKYHQEEMAYGLSNGHVTDDFTWPPEVLWGSTVGYRSDSLESCLKVWLKRWYWGGIDRYRSATRKAFFIVQYLDVYAWRYFCIFSSRGFSAVYSDSWCPQFTRKPVYKRITRWQITQSNHLSLLSRNYHEKAYYRYMHSEPVSDVNIDLYRERLGLHVRKTTLIR